MTNPKQHHNSKPSQATIDYLRDLAMQKGQSFAWPRTQREASEEIERLKKVRRTSRADRRREMREVRRDMASGRGDAARVRDKELAGYGSTARWADDGDEDREDREAGR